MSCSLFRVSENPKTNKQNYTSFKFSCFLTNSDLDSVHGKYSLATVSYKFRLEILLEQNHLLRQKYLIYYSIVIETKVPDFSMGSGLW